MSKECIIILSTGQKSFKVVKKLDNTKVICEYWALKNDPDVRVVGTELQLYNFFCKKLKEDGWQIRLDYEDELLPQYLNAYNYNNKKPLLINLK